MIAKRVPNKQAKPRAARLVKYIVDAEGKLDPRSWERTADYILCSKTNKYGEKVGGVRVTNCYTNDPAAATTLIEATQAMNTRSKTDKTYHLVFSFPPGEEPDLKTLHAIEDELVAAIGFKDHQRISAVHIDTDHLHVHVAINKVHPTGFQNIEPYYDKKKLMETCERLEIEHGLIRTNHGLDGREPKVKTKDRQAQAEAHSGIDTLTGFIKRELVLSLKEAKTWKEAHSILAKHGLQIKKRGAGLVIGSGELWARASQCDRELSIKAMTDRLGPMESTQSVRPAKPFEPKPRQSHPSSAVLYEQYQRERNARQQGRERGLEQLRYEAALLDYNLRKWRVTQRLLAKATAKGPQRRVMLKMIDLQTKLTRNSNRKAIDKRRREFLAGSSFPSWAGWLSYQAEGGNTEALLVLRSRQERQAMQGDCLTAKTVDDKSNITIPKMNPVADKNGSITYKTMDRGIVVDHKAHVQCFRFTAGSAQMALELAAKRFTGQALVVEGSEEFQKEVARQAGIRGVQVRFASLELETARKAAIPVKAKTINKGIEHER